ncbi:MAG TPA: hypothetical protein VEO01_36955 [Pseudonocardiaceae bacterium]|nr:hypothetical protein [Pseudonocardiaceae bacterium]
MDNLGDTRRMSVTDSSFGCYGVWRRCPACKSEYAIEIAAPDWIVFEFRDPGCPRCSPDPVGAQLAIDVSEVSARPTPGGLGSAIQGGGATSVPTRHFAARWAGQVSGRGGFVAYEFVDRPDGPRWVPIDGAALDRERATANEAVDLAENGVTAVVAEKVAERFADPAWKIVEALWSPEQCVVLEALATALDAIRTAVVSGVAAVVRVTVRLTGAPELLAVLAGEIVARAFAASVLHPLTAMSYFLRLSGTVACAVKGCPGGCRCARVLGRQLSIDTLAGVFEHALDRLNLPSRSDQDMLLAFVVMWKLINEETAMRRWQRGEPRTDAPVDLLGRMSQTKARRRRLGGVRRTDANVDQPSESNGSELSLLGKRLDGPEAPDGRASDRSDAQVVDTEFGQESGFDTSL